MLKQEHTEIMTNLGKVEADDVLSRDRNQTETLVDLVQSADGAKQAVVEENQKIAQLDAEVNYINRGRENGWPNSFIQLVPGRENIRWTLWLVVVN